MSTNIRPEISKNKDYHVSKHRMYELRHFCLQYPEWKEQYDELDDLEYYARSVNDGMPRSNYISDPVGNASKMFDKKMFYLERIGLVEDLCSEVAENLWPYLLKGVTEGVSYPYLNVPCCKEVYYDMYRKFFWLLDKKRK